MTTVPLEVFEIFVRAVGIEDGFEYMELYRRGVLPTKLIPRNPSKYYHHNTGKKRKILSMKINKLFEKKYGIKYNKKKKNDQKKYRAIYEQTHEVKARRKAYRQRPESKAILSVRQKAYRQTPEFKAKAYSQKPEYIAKRRTNYHRPKNRAWQKAYSQRPEVKARDKVYRATPEYKAKARARANAWYQRQKK